MAVNRFNRPIQPRIHQNYVSQYVPMPLDAITAAMGAKQATYDQEYARAAEFQSELLNRAAYGTQDTQYLQGVQENFEEYINEIAEQDLSDPGIYNTLRSKIKTLGQDDNLKRIQQSYQVNQALLEREKELVEKGGHAYNAANFYRAKKAAQDYAQGEGFRGGVLNTGLVQEGLNERDEIEKYYNNMQASGSDQVLALDQLATTFYKKGWKGISANDVAQKAEAQFNGFVNSPIGLQIQREYEMMKDMGALEEGVSRKDYLWGRLLAPGAERIHGVSSTNIDQALNRAADKKKEEEGQSVVVQGKPRAKSTADKGFSRSVFVEDGKLKTKTKENTKDVALNIIGEQLTSGNPVGSAVFSTYNFFRELIGGGDTEEIDLRDPEVAILANHLANEMPEFYDLSPEEQNTALADYVTRRSEMSLQAPIVLTTNSKTIKNFNDIFVPLSGSGNERQVNLNAASYFKFTDESGNTFSGTKLQEYMDEKGIESINYTGTSQDITSDVEYGSTILTGNNGEMLIMSPSETDKSKVEYFANRVLSARTGDFVNREFEWNGNEYRSIYLPDGTFRVQQRKGKEFSTIANYAVNDNNELEQIK